MILKHFLPHFVGHGDMFAYFCGPRAFFLSKCGPHIFELEIPDLDDERVEILREVIYERIGFGLKTNICFFKSELDQSEEKKNK